ncbi:MAG: hypothetical protein ABSE17_03170 [Candidatus Levyibacteriota bacterium]|jgi:hypothetical protein
MALLPKFMHEKPQPNPNPSRIDKAVGNILYEAATAVAQWKIIDPNHYLDMAIDVLYPWPKDLKTPGGVIIGINHTSMKDAIIGARIISEKLTNPNRGMGVVTVKYFDETRKDFRFGKAFAWATSKIQVGVGFELTHVVRPGEESAYYAMPEHAAIIDNKTPDEFNFASNMKAVRRIRKGTVEVIAPETTRSATGELAKTSEIDAMLRLSGDKSVFLPLGLVPVPHEKGIIGEIKRLLTKVEVRVGRPMTYQELVDETETNNAYLAPLLVKINAGRDEEHQLTPLTVSDTMMLQIAKLLPENYRGYYKKYVSLLKEIN